ncbi:MAG: hypothetical protein JO156_07790 [Solirubrobacterales bacterium]|nr:hypothetical protein [Solirubrobacterales bacterium]
MRRRGGRSRIAAAGVAALALTACGSSSLSSEQLRGAATRLCSAASKRAALIPTPSSPAAAAGFLSQGAAALSPELAGLRALHAPGDLAQVYATAVGASSAELSAIQAAVRDLAAGGDEVITVKSLQQQLAPMESEANGAWQALQIPACLNH